MTEIITKQQRWQLIGITLLILSQVACGNSISPDQLTATRISVSATQTATYEIAATQTAQSNATRAALTATYSVGIEIESTRRAVGTIVSRLPEQERSSQPDVFLALHTFDLSRIGMLIWVVLCVAFLFERNYKGLRRSAGIAESAWIGTLMLVGALLVLIISLVMNPDALGLIRILLFLALCATIILNLIVCVRSFTYKVRTDHMGLEMIVGFGISVICIGSVFIFVWILTDYVRTIFLYFPG